MNGSPSTVYRKNYKVYPFKIRSVSLTFDLDVETTYVRNIMHIFRKSEFPEASVLILEGEELSLISLILNGKHLNKTQYALYPNSLHITNFPEKGILEIFSSCKPSTNSALMGLYISKGTFVTQCEPEGFRRITWFADRPDVKSLFSVKIRGKFKEFPVMLSNGHLISKSLSNEFQEVHWIDPFPKPCYLFALVAGNLAVKERSMKTNSGRNILLQVYSDHGLENKTEWALYCLHNAIQWDEYRYGLELDLDRFMLVAVHDFNMGAMENKGLNIFNSACILANQDTATDSDYENIESIVSHEYFHNWTGNRVSCRDWFQLSLKEGLTVFRDQQFSADMSVHDLNLPSTHILSAKVVKRIDNVLNLLSEQFPEDSSSMAHPIQPNSYLEVSNFYTATIYEKGAEVVRMQHTLLGEDGFCEGLRNYLQKYDGQSATCDNFLDSMESIYMRKNPGKNFSVFRRWYQQAGTPELTIQMDYNQEKRQCTLRLRQDCPLVGIEKIVSDNKKKKPFHIPFAIGLLDNDGRSIPLILGKNAPCDSIILDFSEVHQEWVFEEVPVFPIPSLLRNFSAPVSINYPYTNQELTILALNDKDLFSRWAAAQALAIKEILNFLENKNFKSDNKLTYTWKRNLEDEMLDFSYRARILRLPNEKVLSKQIKPRFLDPLALSNAVEIFRQRIGDDLSDSLELLYNECCCYAQKNIYNPYLAGKRALKNLVLEYLAAGETSIGKILARKQYEESHNMTDQIHSLSILINYCNEDISAHALEKFFNKWKQDDLVIDKWFSLQAKAHGTNASKIQKLMKHPMFDLHNPNRVRALVFQFCMNNPRGFHKEDGSGYDYWTEQVLSLDLINPELSARLARAFDNWFQFTEKVCIPMKKSLENIMENKFKLSKNVIEIISKSLKYTN